MADEYLLKTEPSEYSFENLQRDKITVWDGVSNPVALRNLGQMKPGVRLIIYETADRKSAVGTASVVSVDLSNPKNPAVEIEAGKSPRQAHHTIAEIKANKLFADSPLVLTGEAFRRAAHARAVQVPHPRLIHRRTSRLHSAGCSAEARRSNGNGRRSHLWPPRTALFQSEHWGYPSLFCASVHYRKLSVLYLCTCRTDICEQLLAEL